jgi:hypothetical protein
LEFFEVGQVLGPACGFLGDDEGRLGKERD